MKYLSKLILMFVVVFLASCADDDSSSTTTTTGATATTGGSITITLQDSAGTATSSVSLGSTNVLTFTVKDLSGVIIANKNISISTSLGSFTNTLVPQTNTSKTTDANGQVITSIFSKEVADSFTGIGAGTISASTAISTADVTATKDFEVVKTLAESALANPSLLFKLKNSGGTEVESISLNSPGTLEATVLDVDGSPVSNALVTFSTDLGVIDPESGRVLTNNLGVATIPLSSTELFGQNGGIGAGTVSVRVSTVSGSTVSESKNFTVLRHFAVTSFSSKSISIALKNSAGTATNSLSLNSVGVVSVIVTDATGALVENEVVTFSTSLASLSPVSGTVLTDSNGLASLTLLSKEVADSDEGIGADIVTATISVNGTNVSVEKSYQVTATNPSATSSTKGTIVLTLEDSGGSAATSISLTSRGALKAIVKNADNVVINNALVSFATSLAVFSPSTGASSTNSSGLATINLDSAEVAGSDTGLGAAIVTATVTIDGEEISTTLVYEVVTGLSTPSGSSTISVTLKDGATTGDTDITTISADTVGFVTAIVLNADSNAVVGQLVTFTTTLAKFNPILGTALTDSSGHAKVELQFSENIGADSFTATAVVNEATISASQAYQVVAPSVKFGDNSGVFSEGTLQVAANSLSAGGSTSISAYFVNSSNVNFTTPIDVGFSTVCSSLSTPTATIDKTVATSSGIAKATYVADGCVGVDTITATATFGGETYTATGTLTVASDTVGSIRFISATPENITLKGAGGAGLQETSQILFKVVGASGEPLKDQAVTFTSNTSVGGLSFSPTTAISNASGEVFTVVQAGTAPAVVNIIATVDTTTITTQSTGLNISAGLPAQNSFTLSVSENNPEAYTVDGQTVVVTARLADIYNNPPPVGTAISFVTEAGSIGASCETDDAGTCSVDWTSQGVRPTDFRSSIVAYTQGVESFTDRNGNGTFDESEIIYTDTNGNGSFDKEESFVVGDTVIDAGQAFIDSNGNGVYDITGAEPFTDLPEVFNNENDETNLTYDFGEFFADFNASGLHENSGDGKYTGNVCNTGCSTNSTLNVSARAVIVMSASFATISTTGDAGINVRAASDSDAAIETAKIVVTVSYQDTNGQTLPSGTIIAVSTDAGSLSGETSLTVGNTTTSGVKTFAFTVADSDSAVDKIKTGNVTITVTSPKGFKTAPHTFKVTE